MSSAPIVDVAIVGAGPIGLAAAIEAKAQDLSTRVFDKGCLVNSLYHYPNNMTFFSTADRLEIGNIPFISQNIKPTKQEALEYYRQVAIRREIVLNLFEKIDSLDRVDQHFILKSEQGVYRAKNVILSTGFFDFPFKMGVPGEELDKVRHYYSDPHPYFGQHLAIVGAANSAVDAALETYRKGAASVTMIIRDHEIRPSVKYWVRPDIENRIQEGEIKAYFNAEITSISSKAIEIVQSGEKVTIKNDFVLAMTGYQPDFSFLKKCGIRLSDDAHQSPVYDRNTMETNVPGIYLAGVICGGHQTNKWFIENSRIHAVKAIQHIKASQNSFSVPPQAKTTI